MKYFSTILSFLIIFFGIGVFVAYAQNYVPLAPLPGTYEAGIAGSKTTNLSLYLSGAIKLLIALGAALAVLYAIIGGTQYVAASINPSAKKDALERVWGALIGLAIILTSYLLLNSINPELVNVNFSLPTVTPSAAELQRLAVVPGAPTFCASVTSFSFILNSPEAKQMEDANGKVVIFASTDTIVNENLKKLQGQVSKLQNALRRIGASAEVTSAYRPYAYQKHLYQLYNAWKVQGLENNTNPACSSIKTVIGNEYRKHGLGSLVSNPDTQSSPHVNGTGVDIKLTGIRYEEINEFMTRLDIKLKWAGIKGDEVHFDLIQ